MDETLFSSRIAEFLLYIAHFSMISEVTVFEFNRLVSH